MTRPIATTYRTRKPHELHGNTQTSSELSQSPGQARHAGEEAMQQQQRLSSRERCVCFPTQPASATVPPFGEAVCLTRRPPRSTRSEGLRRAGSPPPSRSWVACWVANGGESTFGPAPERRGNPSVWYPCRVPTHPCLPTRMLSFWGHRAAPRT